MAPVLVRQVASTAFTRGPSMIRAACVHLNAASLAKREDKWKSNAHGYMDADSVRKRHTAYEKRLRRAEAKRKIHREWRCLEVDGDGMKAVLEQESQPINSRPQHASSSSTKGAWWSQRFENDWNRFCRKHKARRSEPGPQSQRSSGSQAEADPFSETAANGSRNHSSSHREGNHWSSSRWEYYAGRGTSWTSWDSRGPSSSSHTSRTNCLSAERMELGLAPTGPLTVAVVKHAFRQCALKWHPDRHAGASKELAESKFKRVGASYRALLKDLEPS